MLLDNKGRIFSKQHLENACTTLEIVCMFTILGLGILCKHDIEHHSIKICIISQYKQAELERDF